MAAEKPKRKYVLDAGVGVNLKPNVNGWGADSPPHLAVLVHPLKGMTFWGPFITETAAHEWVRREGDGAAMEYYGERGESRWFVAQLFVPTHPEGE